MIEKLGVQLFTVRDFMGDPDFADVALAKLRELGYTEAHTAGNAFDAKLFGELLHKHGISVVGTHYDWNKIVNSPEETMEIHRMWGTTTVGTGAMPMPPRTNLDELKKYVDEFNRVSEIYAKNGFRLSYHNHHFEFVRIDSPAHASVRVWERGAGPTLACGTGATATFFSLVREGLIEKHAVISLPGGDLEFDYLDNGHAVMTGPAQLSYKGSI